MGQRATRQTDATGKYLRRLDIFDYRARRRDMPHDISELLELARDIELEDTIAIDHELEPE